MNKILPYLFLFILAGCSKTEKKPTQVFFAGEIVNPKSKQVVLYKGDVIIDSAQLDNNNRFSFQLDSIENGLYYFKHAPELQYVYLEQGDSLMIRLNTIDFDESLVFSGKGEEINNFLLDLFLANENNLSLLSKYYKLEPKEFFNNVVTLRNEKLKELEALTSEVELSKEGLGLAKASIDYTYFTYMEKYPLKHKKHSKQKTIKSLPDFFYEYRKRLDFDNENLTFLRPYYYFMITHFGNLAYTSCSYKCEFKNDVVKNQLHFNQHKLKLIDSLAKENKLKDKLFRNVAFNYLLEVHDEEKNNSIFIEEFRTLSKDNRHINEINNLYEGIKNIQPKKRIPNVLVLNNKGEQVSLPEIAKNKKTVFYFWSGKDKRHFENISKQAAKLKLEKPTYSFVGINFSTDETSWKNMIKTANLNEDNQFRSENYSELNNALIIYPLNKCIITNDAKIVNAFSDMYRPF